MFEPLSVSVVIPAHNAAGVLPACLDAVLASTCPPLEVVVVDDASTDGSTEVAARFPCRRVRLPRNAGPAAARNRGVEATRGEILFFLDADVVVEPDTLERIVAAFGRAPEVEALFCSYRARTPAQGFFSAYKNLVHHHTHQTSSRRATTFCGGFGAIRRATFLRLGGFDERYRWLEDIELGYRLHQAGCLVTLERSIQVTHLKRYTLRSLLRSDVVGRAIPWTRLMLERRIFRADLNTQPHNVLSVALSLVLPACVALAVLVPFLTWISCLLLVSLLALNYRFLAFVRGEMGALFAARAALMHWFAYLYSGVGLLLGCVSFVLTRRGEAPGPRVRAGKPVREG